MISYVTYELLGRELLKKDRRVAGEKYQQLEERLMDRINWPKSFYEDGLTHCDFVERYIAGALTEEQKNYLTEEELSVLAKEYERVFCGKD